MFAGLRLNPVTATLSLEDDHGSVLLGSRGVAVLDRLIRAQGELVPPRELIVAVSDPAGGGKRLDRTVRDPAGTVRDLNHSLQRLGSSAVIVNIRGRGWRLAQPHPHTTATFADLVLDPMTRQLRVGELGSVRLGRRSSSVLDLLIGAQGELVSNAEFLQVTRDPAGGIRDITRALRRLGAATAVLNTRGAGWRLVHPPFGTVHTFADLTWNPLTRKLIADSGSQITVSAGDGEVLHRLILAHGAVVPARDMLLVAKNAAGVIRNLRWHFSEIGTRVMLINAPGQGWQLADPLSSGKLTFADVTFDPGTRRMLAGGAGPSALGPQSATVLGRLIQAQGRVVLAAELDRGVGQPARIISILNRRLHESGARTRIVNLRNVGWKLAAAGDRPAVSFADLTFDPSVRELSRQGQDPVYLGPRSSVLLEMLIQARGKAVPAAALRPAVGPYPADAVQDLNRQLNRHGVEADIVLRPGQGWSLRSTR